MSGHEFPGQCRQQGLSAGHARSGMSPTFTDDDAGKRVETAAGETLGVVATTEDETAYVEANEDAVDSIKAVLDWEADTDEIVALDGAAVGEVTAEAIRLEAAPSTTNGAGEGTDPVIERDESTEGEDVGAERRDLGSGTGETGDEVQSEGEGRSGKSVQPETEDMAESGAERHPDDEGHPPDGEQTVTKDRGREEDR